MNFYQLLRREAGFLLLNIARLLLKGVNALLYPRITSELWLVYDIESLEEAFVGEEEIDEYFG